MASGKDIEYGGIREVPPVVETFYFVEDLHWQGEEVIAEMARQLDAEDRREAVAKSSRSKWATEILMEELWARVKKRRDIRRWSRQIILDKTNKVILCNRVIRNLVADLVDKSEEEAKKARIEVGNKKRKELVEREGWTWLTGTRR